MWGWEPRHRSFFIILVFLILVVVLLLFLRFFMNKEVIGPVKVLSDTSEKTSAGKSYGEA